MKIISKFTDFYEYDCYRYGEPDQSIEWYRCTETIKNLCDSEIFKCIKKKYLLSFNAISKNKILNTVNAYITVIENVIGVYPYVYYLPRIVYKERWDILNDFSIEESIKCLTIKNAYKEIFKNKGLNHNRIININQIVNAGKNVLEYSDNSGIKITEPLIIEDREIFNHIKQPIFYLKIDQNASDYRYYDICDFYINPCLCTDTPLLEHYPNILGDRDIYTDIENFLWNQKQEPMIIPDNKTKILSHGFDLKTSFRKM